VLEVLASVAGWTDANVKMDERLNVATRDQHVRENWVRGSQRIILSNLTDGD
jgi:hypothetical protein